MITYSKIIFLLKVSFFISAGGILAVLFIISPRDDFGDPVKISTLGLEKNISYQISNAKLIGSSDLGHYFNFTVDSIDPEKANKENFLLSKIKGSFSLNSTEIYEISANQALFSPKEKFVALKGNLEIKTNSGITGRSEEIRIDFEKNEISSAQATTLKTPIGMIKGGAMKISSSTNTKNIVTRLYLFDGVNMVLPRSNL